MLCHAYPHRLAALTLAQAALREVGASHLRTLIVEDVTDTSAALPLPTLTSAAMQVHPRPSLHPYGGNSGGQGLFVIGERGWCDCVTR